MKCSPKQSSVFHVLCIFIEWLLRADANPEEIFWLFSFIYHLKKREKENELKKTIGQDVMCMFGFS